MRKWKCEPNAAQKNVEWITKWLRKTEIVLTGDDRVAICKYARVNGNADVQQIHYGINPRVPA